MLLSNRRAVLIHFCLAAMQAAWITPFWLLLYRSALAPWISFAQLLGVLLAWMLVLELLSRTDAKSPVYDLISLLLMALTSLAAVRLILYGDRPIADIGWMGRVVADTLNSTEGLPPAIVLVGFNLLLWQRATAATSRDLSFLSVGMSFRGGMLMMMAVGAFYTASRGPELLPFLWLYFALGLTAVAVARVNEKAAEAQSAGALLPLHRLAQVLAAVGVTLGAILLMATGYTPDGLRRVLHWLDPLWNVLRPMVFALVLALGRILNPLLMWLEARLADLLSGWVFELASPIATPTGSVERPGLLERLPGWPLDVIRGVLVLLLVVGATLGFLVFMLLYLEKVRRSGDSATTEEESAERVTLGGGIIQRGLRSLRRAARLVQRFGVGRQLLAAISVQNIYANLCRIARRRGMGRLAAQPPDDYLDTLIQVFPGQEERLARITAAYMRVHYGDHPVTLAELGAVREDYRAVREAEPASLRENAG